MVENTIKNGVKHTLSHFGSFPPPSKNNIQNVIQNGVKNTFSGAGDNYYEVDNTIQNGVKESYPHYFEGDINVKDTIKNGVKVMMSGSEWYHQDEVNDLIEKGVKIY
jgi:predicted peroxiredoxin